MRLRNFRGHHQRAHRSEADKAIGMKDIFFPCLVCYIMNYTTAAPRHRRSLFARSGPVKFRIPLWQLKPPRLLAPGERVKIYHVRHCGVAVSVGVVTGVSNTEAPVSPHCFSMCAGVLLNALCVTLPRASIWYTSRWFTVAAVTVVRVRFT